jgi:hypothetical protein
MRKFVGALVFMLAVGIGTFADEGYERYLNIGYGYTVKYPKDVFAMVKELDDKSGITLISTNKDDVSEGGEHFQHDAQVRDVTQESG